MFICMDPDGYVGKGKTADEAYKNYLQLCEEESVAVVCPGDCEFFSATQVKCVMKTEPLPTPKEVTAKK